MGHRYLRTAAWLVIQSFGVAACGGDDSSNENPSTQEESGSGGSGVKTTTGGRGGTAAAGRGTGTSAAGRSALPGVAGATGVPLAGIGAPAGGRTAPSLNTAGADAAGTSASAGSGGAIAQAGANAQAGAGGTRAIISLSDAQIASVLFTADEGEVQQNTLAVTRATAPAARVYAQDLIDMHRAADTRLTALLTTINISAQGNPVTDSLRQDSERIVAKLQGEPGTTFDMTYLQSQIEVHIKVLNLIDQTLLPNAKNEQLRNEIVVVRSEVALHLARARTLAATLDLDVDAGVGSESDAGL
jgi:putative membrane protein